MKLRYLQIISNVWFGEQHGRVFAALTTGNDPKVEVSLLVIDSPDAVSSEYLILHIHKKTNKTKKTGVCFIAATVSDHVGILEV